MLIWEAPNSKIIKLQTCLRGNGYKQAGKFLHMSPLEKVAIFI
jgi:hypothetical protein